MNKYRALWAGAVALMLIALAQVRGAALPDPKKILDRAANREYRDISLTIHLTEVMRAGARQESEARILMKRTPEAFMALREFTAPENYAGIKSLSVHYTDPAKPASRWLKLAGRDWIQCQGSNCSRQTAQFGFNATIVEIAHRDADLSFLGLEKVAGKMCFKIESRPKNPDVYYAARIVMWVDSKMYAPRKIESYDVNGRLLDRSTYTEFKKVGDSWWETKGKFEHVPPMKTLYFEITAIKLNQGIPDEVFAPPPAKQPAPPSAPAPAGGSAPKP